MIHSLFFFFILILLPAAYAGLSAAPFVPVNHQDIDLILRLVGVKPDEKFYDLGAGDGRVILKAVQEYKVKAVGIEIQPTLVLLGKLKAFSKGIDRKKLQIKWGDFIKEDLKTADIVFFCLMPKAMPKISPKLKKELKKGTRVISYIFPIPEWKEKKVVKSPYTKYPIYLYKLPPIENPGFSSQVYNCTSRKPDTLSTNSTFLGKFLIAFGIHPCFKKQGFLPSNYKI